jgi:hypothetical protein
MGWSTFWTIFHLVTLPTHCSLKIVKDINYFKCYAFLL